MTSLSCAVFFGNPGREYRESRHNAGWLVLERLAEIAGPFQFTQRFKGVYAKHRSGNRELHLLRPECFYNKIGESVQACLRFYKHEPGSILAVHDDMETPFGTVVLQFAGGLGGNNGLRSVVQSIGTDRFFRLKIGIGRPVHHAPDAWVLGSFSPDERIRLPLVLECAAQMLIEAVRDPDRLGRIEAGEKAKTVIP